MAATGASWLVPWSEEAPGIYSALDESPSLAEGGRFDYRLSGRLSGEDWQLLRTESVLLDPVLVATTLFAPHPNPLNPRVRLSFTLAQSGPARMTIFDLAGRRMARLIDGPLPQGVHERLWDGRDDQGRELASGVYFLRLDYSGGSQTRKLTVLR